MYAFLPLVTQMQQKGSMLGIFFGRMESMLELQTLTMFPNLSFDFLSNLQMFYSFASSSQSSATGKIAQ